MAQGGGGMSRVFVTLPVVYLASNLDWKNPQLVLAARLAYASFALAQLLMFWTAQRAVRAANNQTKIKVKEQAKGFMGPTGEPTVKRTTYFEYESEKASQGLQQTLMTLAMMAFFSLKLEIQIPLVVQCVTAPFTVWDSPLLRKYIFGHNVNNAWDEVPDDGTDDEPVEDAADADQPASADAAAGGGGGGAGASATTADLSAAETKMLALMNRTWESRQALDAEEWSAIVADGCDANWQTPADGWSALMVACGAPASNGDEIRTLLAAGANPRLADNEGWTSFHWASFHASAGALRVLLAECSANDVVAALAARAADGSTPVELARQETNTEIEALLTSAVAPADGAAAAGAETESGGVRRRKGAEVAEEPAPAASVEDID